MTGIKPRVARVTIYQGDDLARLAELDDAVARAEVRKAAAERAVKAAENVTRTLADEVPDATAEVEAFDAAVLERDEFAAEAEERGVTVVLNALPRKTWRALVADHPPREDKDSDKQVGVNEDALAEVLVPKSIDHDASTITGDVGLFLDALSDYDFDRLYVTAFALNRGAATADPTLRLASGTSQT